MATSMQEIDPEFARKGSPAKDAAPVMLPDGGASVEIAAEDDPMTVEEMPDGSAVVNLGGEEDGEREEPEFLANLAETLEPSVLARMCTELTDAINRDKESRKKRDEQYAEGLQRTGLGQDAPGGASFQGASRAVHPMLVEGCVDFAARVMKEVFPAKGPVKTQIIGRATREKIERAERKKTFMNWQCTTQMKELRAEFEQMMTQVPLGGSQYMKVWHDDRFNRPKSEFIAVDQMYLPYATSDFRSAARRTHMQLITRAEFESRVRSGLYRDIKIGADAPAITDETDASKANDKIEGREDALSYNEDGLRRVFEIYVTSQVVDGDNRAKEDGDQLPAAYIITIDESSNQVLSVYRNWKEDDEKREELPWIVEFKMLPWRGAYGIGLLHVAGSLSGAATGALRALLDSAHIANFPGGIKLKGARMSGQSVTTEPTQLAEIEGPVNIDDIRKLAMPFPFPGPSVVLFQLLEYCVAAGKGVINTAEEKIADASATAPVGTTLAMIEQGSITFSSVHSRMHEGMKAILEIIHRLDGDYLDDEMTVEELSELVVEGEDLTGPMGVIPVSDPNIFSETQRYAQLQEVLKLVGMFPGEFKVPVLLQHAMRLLQYPGYEEVLASPLEAEELDALTENVRAGKPETQLESYRDQNHVEHLRAHLEFAMSPIFCANPLMAMPAMPKLIDHCKQHLLMLYEQHTTAATKAVTMMGERMGVKDEGGAASQGARIASQELAEELKELIPLLMQAQEAMKQFMPPASDPALKAVEMQEATKKEIAQMREQTAQGLAQLREQGEQQRKIQELQAKLQEGEASRAAEAARHTEEMAIAAQNAAMAERSEQVKQEFGAVIAQMREDAAADRSALAEASARERAAMAEDMRLTIATMQTDSAEYIATLRLLLDEKVAAQENALQVKQAQAQARQAKKPDSK